MSVAIAYIIITSAQSVVGEIVPKLYTIQHAEGLARRTARPLEFFRSAVHPFIFLLNKASYSLLRDAGHRPRRRA